ncbi:Alpha/beta hydrolase fold-1 [Lasiodiplodia theobromae]|uniref:Bifunctional epoxide hydrolase 2 n=3 Tax=Lasiodiplodia TaxID=66739 RepID=A0A5N5DMB1_9PEZI|nr:Bifunctional epoxide hydrolase 2 [Lasiodiplodia theobromae]KAF9637930.1 Alpha/beta hydrolase fold-1 [Lasiodiplodia theobromae]KAK0659638.1 Bifunctional epoxide hydrolase 2 [Lasiodiplodia hormozganensis]
MPTKFFSASKMADTVTKLSPGSDPRVSYETAVLNGRTYRYILGVPKDGQFKATIVLVHGWPDLAFGWRYQIPALIEMGFRVVAPDMMGYGGTDAPRVPPESISLYGFKRAADDIEELARQLGAPKIVLGGHDWGGAVVYRVALWKPDLISHVFAISTPYAPPSKEYFSVEQLVAGPLPQFKYQLNLASGKPEEGVKTKEDFKKLLVFITGGKGPNDELLFNPYDGIILENLGKVPRGPWMTEEELDYYAEQYARNGLHGPCNWYRTRKVNYEEELNLPGDGTIKQPILYIATNKDTVLKPEMSAGMEKLIPNLSRAAIDTHHFGQWEKPAELNDIIKQWVDAVVFGGKSVL